MEAMYPGDADATTGSFVVLNPEGVDAVRALVDAWEASGKEPASEALEALAPLRASLTLAVPDGETRGTVTLRVSLPREYPGSPPALEVSASHLPRGAATEMADTLVRFAATLTSDLGEDGGECLMELAVEAQNEASSCAEREARRRAELGAATRGSDDEPDACHAVVRVDHMNDSKGYVRTLQKWCANLGLDARVFWSEPSGVPTAASDATSRPQKSWTSEDVDGEPETTARGVVGPPTGGRVENVFVVVGGDGDDVQKFLARLRTECIDVDSKGNKCAEHGAVPPLREPDEAGRIARASLRGVRVREGGRRKPSAGGHPQEVQPAARRDGRGSVPSDGGMRRRRARVTRVRYRHDR